MSPNAVVISLWTSWEVGQSKGKLGHYKYAPVEDTGSPSSSFWFLFCFLAIMGWSPLLCSPGMLLWTAIGSK